MSHSEDSVVVFFYEKRTRQNFIQIYLSNSKMPSARFISFSLCYVNEMTYDGMHLVCGKVNSRFVDAMLTLHKLL